MNRIKALRSLFRRQAPDEPPLSEKTIGVLRHRHVRRNYFGGYCGLVPAHRMRRGFKRAVGLVLHMSSHAKITPNPTFAPAQSRLPASLQKSTTPGPREDA